MSKSHVLTVEIDGETRERKVDSLERLIVRSGRELRSWPVREVGRVEIAEAYADEHCALYMHRPGGTGAVWEQLPRGAVLELGDDRYPVSEIGSLILTEIVKAEPPAALYSEGTYRLHLFDGTVQQILEVARLERVNSDGSVVVLEELAGVAT